MEKESQTEMVTDVQLKNYFMSSQQDTEALHLSDRSLSGLVSRHNWGSIGEFAQGKACLDTGQLV